MARRSRIQDLHFTSPNQEMSFLNATNFTLERDILNISSCIFNIERILKRGEDIEDNVVIEVSEYLESNTNLKELKEIIQKLIDFTLMYDIDIDFSVKDTNKYKRRKDVSLKDSDNICLFSAGVDSLSGILKTNEHYNGNVTGVFVAHCDQTRGININDELSSLIWNMKKIPIKVLYAPPMERFGYSQIRGFLYCMYGGIYLNMLNGKRLIVTECGPTMYQPSFSPIDQITMTTHPYIMQKTKKILELILNKSFDLIVPYENLTKAEVIRVSPDVSLMEKSHSCISVGYGTHDGTCYGCIIRRLSFLTAGVKDTTYEKNPFIDDKSDQDNLLNLLRFCSDVIMDYDNMDLTFKENIVTYGKEDLFYRFALDVFAGVYRAKEKHGNLSKSVENIYNYTISGIGLSTLLKRLNQVQTDPTEPNFLNWIKS